MRKGCFERAPKSWIECDGGSIFQKLPCQVEGRVVKNDGKKIVSALERSPVFQRKWRALNASGRLHEGRAGNKIRRASPLIGCRGVANLGQ